MNACDINVPGEDLRGNNLKPLVDRAFEWANWFLMRYRDYAQAYFIQPVQSWQTHYALSYYSVHGTSTATVKPVALEDTSFHKILSTDLSLEIWEGIANLDRSYEAPPWIHLLLDARFAAHPGVGGGARMGGSGDGDRPCTWDTKQKLRTGTEHRQAVHSINEELGLALTQGGGSAVAEF
jgi:hypothetical protein